jgi:broad specificity phosphatase PhoE
MRLILVRHGDSLHGQSGIIAGVAHCPGLTKRGWRQAQLLAARLRTTGEIPGGSALLSSPVLRAQQTASVLVDTLGVTAAAPDPDLCEVRVGAAEGLTWDAYRAMYGSFDLVAEPQRPFAPGGECWNDFLARVQQTLDRLAARFDQQTVVAATHAGFIVATVLVAFAIPRPGTGAWLDPTHTSITEWQAAAGAWRLVRYNDTAHLQLPEAR